MDLIILAGGRGVRMGDLTLTQHKGILPFYGKPILAHIIDSLLPWPEIETIFVATGYRSDDIHHIVHSRYSHARVCIIDICGITGTLSRLTATLQKVPNINQCLITGIDIIVPPHLVLQVLHKVAFTQNNTLLCAASQLEVAPTHWLNRVEEDKLVEVAPFDHIPTSGTWLREMGLRYIPPHIIKQLKENPPPNNSYFTSFIRHLVERETVLVHPYHGDWQHFADHHDLARI